jgi:sugar O-acyltransferase (sialic acid O-acetyltransferase NeuD family)
VIFGLGQFADIAYEYFTHDSEYEVVGFTVTSEYRNKVVNHNLPVVPFEELTKIFEPSSHSFFAAVLYLKMNDFRRDVVMQANAMGYELASYVSNRSFVWPNVEIGEHCFIFEGNVVQPFAKIGFNNILWSGNHIGHHAEIGDNCFISSHVVISGSTRLFGSSFVGVNSTLSNNLEIGARSWIGPGVLITRDIPPGSLITRERDHIRTLEEKALEQKLGNIANQVR